MFNWLFGKPAFRFYEDSFARTHAAKLAGLHSALLERQEQGEQILLVTHFTEPFEELQEALNQWSIEYQIVGGHMPPDKLPHFFDKQNSTVALSLAELLPADDVVRLPTEADQKICILVCERHPRSINDDRLEKYCRSIPCNVEVGYFLSFEDPTVSRLVNDTTLRILDLFGMGENEMVTSNMISRRLKTVLAQNANTITTDHPAESAEAWLKLNSK